MALLESSTGLPILRPEQVAALVTVAWQAASFALAATTMIQAQSPTVRLPIIAADLTCGFVEENDQITPTDPDLDELLVVPKKLACITRISRELAMDSTPEVQGVVGSSIARTLARATDAITTGAGFPKAARKAAHDEGRRLTKGFRRQVRRVRKARRGR